ncbi:MAG: alanine racemase [Lachnospiraceae bacterium]|nr:alanine racemase [Lachnospiraceae bacterium]
MKLYERACAYVDLDALLGNLEQMKQNLSADAKIIAVIKTDGYGHGAVPIAKELESIPYVYGYATATAEESFELRRGGMKKPILCLGYTFPESYERLVEEDIRPALFRVDQARQLSEAAGRIGKTAKVHIKVDTGMSRIGITPDETGIRFIKDVMELPHLDVEGIFTHFARADEADKTAVNEQLACYMEFLTHVKEECPKEIPLKHASNSAGIIEMPQAHMDLVRAGIILYGLWPSDEVTKDKVILNPVLSLKSHIVHVKEIKSGTPVSYGGTYVADGNRRIATIPLGYGDGYPRSLSGKGCVLIHGQKAPIVGRVCMDQFMVDVSNIADVQDGDEVTLIGKDGRQELTMEYLGELSGRFNYELACDLSKRIPRVYIKAGEIIATKDYHEKDR